MIIPMFKQWHPLPGVSVLCPTYGRAARLPGLVMSYLKQDYAGPSELVILNDRHDQVFTFDPTLAPSTKLVTILNVPQQFPTLGEKRNRLVAAATFPLVAWWDDDDRYLSGHLTKGVGRIRVGYRGSFQSHIWANDGKSLTYAWARSPFAHAVMEKQAILDAGGFPAQQMHQDVALNYVMNHKLHAFWAESDSGFPTTVYRLPGSSNHTHVGEFDDPTNNAAARAYMQGTVDARVGLGKEPTGTIPIVPKWGVDYDALAAAAWAAQKPVGAP
jgi:hypothetical protein